MSLMENNLNHESLTVRVCAKLLDYERLCCRRGGQGGHDENGKRKGWYKIHKGLSKLVSNSKFEIFIQVIILLNSIVLGTESYMMPVWVGEMQRVSNIVFTVIFTIEMVLKLLGLGFIGYVQDNFNIFDV